MRRVARLLVLAFVGSFVLPAGSAVATTTQLSQAGDRPVVRVGTEGTYPPFTFHESKNSKLTGYDIDVIKAVAKKAGWRLEFVETQFDAIFAALEADRIDVIANQVSINPEREAKYGLSTPYTYSHGVIVVKKGTTGITSLADLKGKTTAQSLTSNWSAVAKKAGAKVEGVEGFAPAAALVSQGRVDAIVNDNIAVLDYLNTTGSDQIEIVGNAGDEVSKQALAFRKDDPRLAEADRALQELSADGTLAKISETYFKADVSKPNDGEVDVAGRAPRSDAEIVKDTAWPMFKGLLKVSIPITIISFAIGLAIAVAVALARISGNRVLSAMGRAYVSVIRGTPLLVQLFIVFFGLPEIGIDFPSYVAGVVALSLNVGGYAAEVVRSAILSVPKGQFEAASTIGMGYWQTLRRIVFPQAARSAVPPLSNTLISLFKDTSLLSVVLLTDLFRASQIAASEAQVFMPLYTFAALYYWIVCVLMSSVQGRVETRLNRFVAR